MSSCEARDGNWPSRLPGSTRGLSEPRHSDPERARVEHRDLMTVDDHRAAARTDNTQSRQHRLPPFTRLPPLDIGPRVAPHRHTASVGVSKRPVPFSDPGLPTPVGRLSADAGTEHGARSRVPDRQAAVSAPPTQIHRLRGHQLRLGSKSAPGCRYVSMRRPAALKTSTSTPSSPMVARTTRRLDASQRMTPPSSRNASRRRGRSPTTSRRPSASCPRRIGWPSTSSTRPGHGCPS